MDARADRAIEQMEILVRAYTKEAEHNASRNERAHWETAIRNIHRCIKIVREEFKESN